MGPCVCEKLYKLDHPNENPILAIVNVWAKHENFKGLTLLDVAKNGTDGRQVDQIVGKPECGAKNERFCFSKRPEQLGFILSFLLGSQHTYAGYLAGMWDIQHIGIQNLRSFALAWELFALSLQQNGHRTESVFNSFSDTLVVGVLLWDTI